MFRFVKNITKNKLQQYPMKKCDFTLFKTKIQNFNHEEHKEKGM